MQKSTRFPIHYTVLREVTLSLFRPLLDKL